MKKAIVFDMDGTLYASIQEDLIEIFNAEVLAKKERKTHIKENKIVLLELKSQGYDLFLASNTTNAFGNYALTRLGIQNLFTETYFYKGDDSKASPDKAIKIKETLAALKVMYSQLFMIGDNYEMDIKPAEELGVNAFQISGKDGSTLKAICKKNYNEFIG